MAVQLKAEPEILAVPRNTIVQGDVLDRLRELPDRCVQTVCTSPPYWSLRDYGTATWDGGDPDCSHELVGAMRTPWANAVPGPNGLAKNTEIGHWKTKHFGGWCAKCAAVRIDQQIGLEPTPQEYIARMVEVFREVRRVLRNDGTLWLNLGDGYASNWPCNRRNVIGAGSLENGRREARPPRMGANLKDKDLIGMPWMVAFALRDDGWYLRADCIWSKANPMPESVTDRPTRSHEYIFLLSKRPKYYYDAMAVVEPVTGGAHMRKPGPNSRLYVDRDPAHLKPGVTPKSAKPGRGIKANESFHAAVADLVRSRNRRTVWTIATSPYREAHFATFPPRLIEPCILAGASPFACEYCGAPWMRLTDHLTRFEGGSGRAGRTAEEVNAAGKWRNGGTVGNRNLKLGPTVTRVDRGWKPTCRCEDATGAARSLVLDPFMGSGTVAVVATSLQRDWLGIELKSEYVEMAQRRLASVPVRLFVS